MLATTRMTKSFKMVLLRVLLDNDAVFSGMPIPELAEVPDLDLDVPLRTRFGRTSPWDCRPSASEARRPCRIPADGVDYSPIRLDPGSMRPDQRVVGKDRCHGKVVRFN
jgi:hypothetical protein